MDVTETPSGGQGAAEPPLQPPELGSFAPARHDAVETTSEQAPKTDPTTGLAALLNNRFILGGLGIVVVLLLTAIVLVAIGHGDDSDAGSQNVAAAPDNEETPTRPIGGLAGTTTMTA